MSKNRESISLFGEGLNANLTPRRMCAVLKSEGIPGNPREVLFMSKANALWLSVMRTANRQTKDMRALRRVAIEVYPLL